MIFHIITIFPEAFSSFESTSIIGKATEKGICSFHYYKLNDFAQDTSGHVDDKAYGMHGQVLSPTPLARAISHVRTKLKDASAPVVYFTPGGKFLKQSDSESFQKKHNEYIIICGHYEGIDQRIIDLYVDYEISLGEFILTGGELPAQIFMDSIIRLIPGVLGKSISHEEESFSQVLDGRVEYPIYTRPQVFEGLSVPEVLTSGNHKKIQEWKFNNLR